MNKEKNRMIKGAAGKPLLLDIFFKTKAPQPVVIYAHGFNGFKDWGSFDLIAQQFAEAGFCFIKFNFSHGGTSPEAPEEFVDLEAYGNNNYTKELYDLQQVINWVADSQNPYQHFIDKNKLFLVGHSRGGGVVLLKAAEEEKVKAVVTWASVSQSKTPWGAWPEERLAQWEATGVEYYKNSRTGQQMPLYYQLYEDYQQHKARLNILAAGKRLTIPVLICHGTSDEAVPVEHGHNLNEAVIDSELFLVNSDHVFGRSHPWPHTFLPEPMQAVVTKTILFLTSVVNDKK